MKCITLIFLLIKFFYVASAHKNGETLDCKDFEQLFVGSIFSMLSKSQTKTTNKDTNFLIATRNHPEAKNIGYDNWLSLLENGFDPAKKTYFITHGFQSGSHKPWILDLKTELLKTVDVNIFLVDWKGRSNQWNYVDAARATLMVRDDIIKFLRELKNHLLLSHGSSSSGMLWNKLYFIGHSLGAQISAQVAHLLKGDEFFKVERITGMDPAQPCFRDCNLDYRLDKDDAEFVDVIHTQTGNGNTTDSFGLRIPMGHLDFYVNGGMTQPKCENSVFNIEMYKKICSHKMACEYFVESVKIARTGEGKFLGHKWDLTSANALHILYQSDEAIKCSDCVEMGFNAKKNDTNGVYIVFTSSKPPYYKHAEDISLQTDCIKQLDVKTNLEQSMWDKLFDSPFEKR